MTMENKTATYYTLKYGQTDSLHKRGEVVIVPSGDVYIGQQADCHVKFCNNTEYENERFAIIRPTRIAGEWQLIPASEFIHTFVNGMPVNLVHYLNDGDRITFEGEEQELIFNRHEDGKADSLQGIHVIAAPMSRGLIAFLIALPIVLFGLIAWYMSRDNIADQELMALRTSVLQISVDSVYYVECTSAGETVLRGFSYQNEEDHVISGTAFVTKDSRIVTARHCIEPWLNDSTAVTADCPEDIASIPTRWAMEAETYNCTHEGDTIYKVVAICDFNHGQNGVEKYGRSYRSTDFTVDTSRDNIVEKGDFFDSYYWRSITETYSNKETILGDVAWVGTDSVGAITLASDEELEQLLTVRQHLHFIGYPDHETMRGLNVCDGMLQMEYVKGSLIAHNGDLIHGYSGAPAIVLDGTTPRVVGIVSRIDANGGGRTYSIPVSELKKE